VEALGRIQARQAKELLALEATLSAVQASQKELNEEYAAVGRRLCGFASRLAIEESNVGTGTPSEDEDGDEDWEVVGAGMEI
jgi:hypothetical protein